MISFCGLIVQGFGAATNTIALQKQHLAGYLSALSSIHCGTINVKLNFALLIETPDVKTNPITWQTGASAETFELTQVELQIPPNSSTKHVAWLYVAHGSPHRDTPNVHEIIAPHLPEVTPGAMCLITIQKAPKVDVYYPSPGNFRLVVI